MSRGNGGELPPLEMVELSETDRRWAHCGVCHQRPAARAVWLGSPSFQAPAVCACLPCLLIAVRMLVLPEGA